MVCLSVLGLLHVWLPSLSVSQMTGTSYWWSIYCVHTLYALHSLMNTECRCFFILFFFFCESPGRPRSHFLRTSCKSFTTGLVLTHILHHCEVLPLPCALVSGCLLFFFATRTEGASLWFLRIDYCVFEDMCVGVREQLCGVDPLPSRDHKSMSPCLCGSIFAPWVILLVLIRVLHFSSPLMVNVFNVSELLVCLLRSVYSDL